jgi:uncharacterized membrane protein
VRVDNWITLKTTIKCFEDGLVWFEGDRVKYKEDHKFEAESFYECAGATCLCGGIILFLPIPLTFFINISFNIAVIISFFTLLLIFLSIYVAEIPLKKEIKTFLINRITTGEQTASGNS